MQYTDIFKTLSKVDVNTRLKEKSGFSYLPWADCEQFAYNAIDPELIKVEQFETEQGLVILPAPGDGFLLKVVVTIAGVARGDWYPVIDYDNRVIKNPNAFDINTALQRAKVKAFAQHGLGLYVFLGKDGPDEHNPNQGTEIPNVPPKKEPAKKEQPAPKKQAQQPKEEPKQAATEPAEETPPWDTDRDFTQKPFDQEYVVDFIAQLNNFSDINSMMSWIQQVVGKLSTADKGEFREATLEHVKARTTELRNV